MLNEILISFVLTFSPRLKNSHIGIADPVHSVQNTDITIAANKYFAILNVSFWLVINY